MRSPHGRIQVHRGDFIPHSAFDGTSDFNIEETEDIALINAMLVRGSGAIETITTVSAVSAEDAVKQMKKAQQMAAAMAYEKPSKS